MKLFTFFCMLAGFTIFRSYAQTDIPASDQMLPKVILPSDHSRLFQVLIDHPVCEYNGLPEITIPLYEIRTKGFTMPVTLCYHAGGVKYNHLNGHVADGTVPENIYFDGEVGAGWSLSVGGYRVMRTINGKPDEMRRKASIPHLDSLPAGLERDRYLSLIHYEIGNHTPFERGNRDYLDGEYDLFSYTLPTSSGKFILDANNRPLRIGTGLDKIEMDFVHPTKDRYDGSMENMTLKDVRGNTFYLGYLPGSDRKFCEKAMFSIGSFSTALDVGWPLMRISTPYNEQIDFTYANHKAPMSRSSVSLAVNGAQAYFVSYIPPTGATPTRLNITEESSLPTIDYGEQLLEKVETGNEVIEIRRNGTPSNVIHGIVVKDKEGNVIKEIRLEYLETNASRWHTLLSRVSVIRNNAATEKYDFEYYDPVGDSFRYMVADQWGYYKYDLSKTQTKLSKRHFIHKEFAREKVVVEDNPNNQPVLIKPIDETFLANEFEEHTVDRSADNERPYSFSLKRITYPTGGTTEYVYEPHAYYSAAMNRSVKGGGQRIRKIITRESSTADALITEYAYGDGKANLDLSPAWFGRYSIFISDFSYEIREKKLTLLTLGMSSRRSFSENPVFPEASMFQVQYGKVTKYRYGSNDTNIRSNGKIVSTYAVPSQFATDRMWYAPGTVRSSLILTLLYSPWTPGAVISYRPGATPLLTERVWYDHASRPVLKNSYRYRTVNDHSVEGIKTDQTALFESRMLREENPINTGYRPYDEEFDYVMAFLKYRLHLSGDLISAEESTSYFGTDSLVVTKNYEYDSSYRIVTETQTGSGNRIVTSEYTYPDAETANGLVLSNILLRKVGLRKLENGSETFLMRFNYSGNDIWPGSVDVSFGKGPLVNRVSMDRYDRYGNIQQATDPNGITTVYLWGYGGSSLIAEVKNATYQQVEGILGAAFIEALSARAVPLSSQLRSLDDLRTHAALSEAEISTYTYRPTIGLASYTDPRGVTVTFLYDDAGRLKEIVDDAGNPIEAYEYNYKR